MDKLDLTPAASPLLELLNGFIVELRQAGLPVSLTENLDAVAAVKHIPIEDREAFKYALAATLVKNHAHWRAFETVFEVYFSLRGEEYTLSGEDLEDAASEDSVASDNEQQQDKCPGQGGGQEGLSQEQLAEMLYRSLMNSDQNLMRAVSRVAVQRFAGMEPGRPVGGTYYLYRTLRNLDLEGVLERMLKEAELENTELDSLNQRLLKDEYEHRIEELKKQIEAEIRRRLVADRGVEAMAKTLRKPLPEDVDFMHASREEMVALKRAIWPLTRKLAARLAGRKATWKKKGLSTFETLFDIRSRMGAFLQNRNSNFLNQLNRK